MHMLWFHIWKLKKDSICDFTSGMCGRYVCNFIFVSTYVCLWLEYLLKITFGAALPSKSIWILCASALDLSCMCYYKLRNAIWSLYWYFQIIIVAFLPFDWVRYGLLYNECLLAVPIGFIKSYFLIWINSER